MASGKNRRVRWFHCDRLERWFAGLDSLGHTGDGTAGPDTGYQHVNVALCISPYLFGSGFPVDFRICRILKLVGHVSIFIRFQNLVCLLNGSLHAIDAWRENKFCSQVL